MYCPRVYIRQTAHVYMPKYLQAVLYIGGSKQVREREGGRKRKRERGRHLLKHFRSNMKVVVHKEY